VETNLRYYLTLLKGRGKLILSLALLTSLVALAGGLLLARYTATATVLVKPQQPPGSTVQPQVGLVAVPTLNILELRGDTYREIVQSRALAEQVVDLLKLDELVANQSFWDLDLTTKAKKLVRDTYTFVIKLLHGKVSTPPLSPREEAIETLRYSISASLLPRTTVLTISVKHRNPEMAMKIANAVAEVFVKFTQEANAREATITRKLLEEQTQNVEGSLMKAQEALQKFSNEAGILTTLTNEADLKVKDLFTYETTLKTTTTEIQASKAKIEQIKKDLARNAKVVESSSTIGNNPLIQTLKTDLVQLESKLSTLLVDFTPKHPQVIALQEQIATLRAALNREVKRIVTDQVSGINPTYQTLMTDLAKEEANLQASLARKEALESIITRFNEQLKVLTEKRAQWELLNNEVAHNTQELAKLKDQLQAAAIAEAQKLSEIKVLDAATRPLFPKVKGFPIAFFPLLGLVVGLMAGVTLVVLLESLDDSVKTPEFIEKDLRLPLYGAIMDTNLNGKGVDLPGVGLKGTPAEKKPSPPTPSSPTSTPDLPSWRGIATWAPIFNLHGIIEIIKTSNAF